MPNRPVRSFFAIVAVLGSVLPGVAGSSASAAAPVPTDPGGGCWRYTPAAGAEIEDVDVITDISTELEPWALDPKMTLATTGATAVGGKRNFTLDLAGGPSVDPSVADESGTAHFFFDVLAPDAPRDELPAVEVEFDIASAAAAIPALQASGSFPLASSGSTTLILRTVFFDLPGVPQQRLVCNGQTDVDLADPDGLVNPATEPQDTKIMSTLEVSANTAVGVTGVTNQDVLTAARPGDAVELALTGFASDATVAVGLCGPSGDVPAACGSTVDVMATPEGAATTSLVVPTNAVLGAGSIRARMTDDGEDVVMDQPLRILGKPTVQLRNSTAENSLGLSGAEWNPMREVSVKAVDDAGSTVGKAVKVKAAADGRIAATLSLEDDAKVAAVVAEQQHGSSTLMASVDVPATPGATEPKTEDEDGGGGGTTATTPGTTQATTPGTTTSAAPAVEAPLDIPLPLDLPVTTVPGSTAGAQALAVTKVRLTGSTQLGELFGAGPSRVLKMQVENVGTAEVVAPGLSIAVGKGDAGAGDSADPVYTSDGFARLAPGEKTDLQIPISLPTGAIGEYTISGQIGESASGAFAVPLETYPWGLFALNALAILLIAVAVRRRMHVPAPSRVSALTATPVAAAPGPEPDAGAAVIDLAVLERWWAADSMTDAVVDVDAVERWLERCSERNARVN